MFKQLADFIKFAVTIGQRTESNQRRINALEAEVNRLSRNLDLTLMELQHFRQHEQDAREKLELRLRLALGGSNPRPPPSGESNPPNDP